MQNYVNSFFDQFAVFHVLVQVTFFQNTQLWVISFVCDRLIYNINIHIIKIRYVQENTHT